MKFEPFLIGKYRKPDSISDIEYRLMVVPEEILTSEQHGILHQATRGESDIVYARHFYDYSGDEYTLIYRRGDGIDSNGEVMKENGSRIFVVTNGLIAKGHIDHDEIRQLDRSGLEEAFQRTNETFVQMWEQGGSVPLETMPVVDLEPGSPNSEHIHFLDTFISPYQKTPVAPQTEAADGLDTSGERSASINHEDSKNKYVEAWAFLVRNSREEYPIVIVPEPVQFNGARLSFHRVVMFGSQKSSVRQITAWHPKIGNYTVVYQRKGEQAVGFFFHQHLEMSLDDSRFEHAEKLLQQSIGIEDSVGSVKLPWNNKPSSAMQLECLPDVSIVNGKDQSRPFTMHLRNEGASKNTGLTSLELTKEELLHIFSNYKGFVCEVLHINRHPRPLSLEQKERLFLRRLKTLQESDSIEISFEESSALREMVYAKIAELQTYHRSNEGRGWSNPFDVIEGFASNILHAIKPLHNESDNKDKNNS